MLKVRLYSFSENDTIIINTILESRLAVKIREFNGVNGCISIFDVDITNNGIRILIEYGIRYFPLGNYESFIITCPNCGNRIDDDMILKVYDENLLSGYNIYCDVAECGCQMANVKYIGE